MPFLELKNLAIGYTEPLVSSIDAELSLGDVCLLVGNNGIGKTTLMRTILGQIPPMEGQIWIKETEIKSVSSEQIPKWISMVFSKTQIPENYTVMDLVSLGKYIHYPYYFKLNSDDLQEVEEIIVSSEQIPKWISMVFSKTQVPENYTVMDLVSLGKYIHYPYYFKLNSDDLQEVEKIIDSLNLTSYKDFPLKKLSDGNLQKAFIGRALAQNTPMIILDEPTTYLDEENKMMILNLLKKLAKEKNKAILFSSHDWRLAKDFSDKIWWLKDHRLKIGETPKNALSVGVDAMEKVFWFVK